MRDFQHLMTRIARNYSMCSLRYFLLLADKLGEARFGRWGSHVCTTSRESGDYASVAASGNFYPRGATHRPFGEVIDDEDRPEREKGKHLRLFSSSPFDSIRLKKFNAVCKFIFIRTIRTIRNRLRHGIFTHVKLKRTDSLFASSFFLYKDFKSLRIALSSRCSGPETVFTQ